VRRIEVVKAVNAVTDPGLARQALDQSLHRFGDIDLAVPYVFHDPATRRFALVIPLPRAHEELTLRAELLQRLAQDTADTLPAYVREARVVLGAAGLRRLVEDERRESQLPMMEERLSRRHRELVQQEKDLAARVEELELGRSDLALRDQELEHRFAELIGREEALGEEEKLVRANTSALNARERRLAALEETLALREQALAPSEPAEPLEDADDATRVHHAPGPSERVEEALPLEDPLDLDPDEATGRHQAVGPAPEPEPPTPEPMELSADEVNLVSDEDERRAPRMVGREGLPMAAVVDAEVRLWLPSHTGSALALLSGRASPVLRTDPDGTLPVALLAVRVGDEDLTRLGLDATRPDDRAVVEALSREFRLRVEVVSDAGRSLESASLAAPCEANAASVLAALDARSAGDEDARRAELARVRADGIACSTRIEGLADGSLEQRLTSAVVVREALAALEPLLDRTALERFLLASGVPRATLDAAVRLATLGALRCGVVPSAAFVQRAVEAGLAPDERGLCARALTAFARTVEAGVAAVGLGPQEASEAWGPLLAWARGVGAAVPEPSRRAVAMLFDPDAPGSVEVPDERAAPTEEALHALSEDELGSWVEHPQARFPAALELARRPPPKVGPWLQRAFRMLPGAHGAALGHALLLHADAHGDLWMELLGSRRRGMAAVGAAGASTLGLRRALSSLVQKALLKSDEDARLFGWAAGQFGAAVVRVVSRSESAEPEALGWLLAHAIRVGAARDLERARTGATAAFQEAASRALGLQDEALAYDRALRTGAGATDSERLAGVVLSGPGGLDTAGGGR
jgi:hypothetical protein